MRFEMAHSVSTVVDITHEGGVFADLHVSTPLSPDVLIFHLTPDALEKFMLKATSALHSLRVEALNRRGQVNAARARISALEGLQENSH